MKMLFKSNSISNRMRILKKLRIKKREERERHIKPIAIGTLQKFMKSAQFSLFSKNELLFKFEKIKFIQNKKLHSFLYKPEFKLIFYLVTNGGFCFQNNVHF